MGETILIVGLTIGMIVVTGVVWWIENGPEKKDVTEKHQNEQEIRSDRNE